MRTAARGISFLMSLKKEVGDRIAGMGVRAAEGKEPGADPCASRRRSRSLKACARCADDGSGHELEVQFSPFKGWILRYIWTLGQIFSTAFMNRSR